MNNQVSAIAWQLCDAIFKANVAPTAELIQRAIELNPQVPADQRPRIEEIEQLLAEWRRATRQAQLDEARAQIESYKKWAAENDVDASWLSDLPAERRGPASMEELFGV